MPKEIGNLSAASLISLKTELLQANTRFQSQKSAVSSADNETVGGKLNEKFLSLKKPNRTQPQPERRGPSRQERQLQEKLEASHEALVRKAKVYEELTRKNGQDSDFSDDDDEDALIDFGRKKYLGLDSTGDDEKHSLPEFLRNRELKSRSRTHEEDMVEVTDEFGRTRQVPRSEVLNYPQQQFVQGETYYGEDTGHDNTTDTLAQHQNPKASYKSIYNLRDHFDSKDETRAMGASHYRFSQITEERLSQQQQLKRMREETLENRQQVVSSKTERERKLAERRVKIKQLKAKKKGMGIEEIQKIGEEIKEKEEEIKIQEYLKAMEEQALREKEGEEREEQKRLRAEFEKQRVEKREWNKDTLFGLEIEERRRDRESKRRQSDGFGEQDDEYRDEYPGDEYQHEYRRDYEGNHADYEDQIDEFGRTRTQ